MTPSSHRRPAQRSLQLLLALLLGSVVGFVTLALVLVFVVRENQDVRERVAQETSSTAESTAALLQTQFEQQLQALAMVAAVADLAADLETGRVDRLNARLEAAAPAFSDFSRLAVIDANGLVVANSASDKSALGLSLADQPYVRQALAVGRASIGRPRRAIGAASASVGSTVLPLGVPIFSRTGQVIGVLQATTQLGHLNADLATIRVGRTGYVSVISPDGVLVAHPDVGRLLTPADDGTAELLEPAYSLAQLGQIPSPSRPLWFARTATMASTGWTVRAQMPVAEAFDSLWQRIVTASLVVVSTSGLAIVLGVAVARRITTPLDRLVRVVEQIGTKSAVDGLPETRVREVAQLASTFRDMHERLAERTARLEASRAAAELAEAQFRAIIEAAPDAVVIRSASGELLFANRQAQVLYGVETQAEMAALVPGSGVPERTRAFHQELNQYLLEHPGEVRIASGPDVCVVRTDGTEIPIEISATCALTPEGPRRISILRDIRERHALDQMKERFVSIVSHELRTPLTPIIGLAQLLLATPLSAKQAEMVETIDRSSQNLLVIVNDLLDLSRMQAGQLEIESTDLDTHALVADTVHLLGARASEKRLSLSWQIAESVPARLLGDPVRLRQILDNLVSNAIKFTHVGGVTVRVDLTDERPTDALVRFAVSDTGIGVDVDTAARIFKPFVQASTATTREYGGTGLGLAICHDLVDLMGGEIGVESVPGQGSTFWFVVRLEKAPAVLQPAGDPSPQRSAPAQTVVTHSPAAPPVTALREVAPILVAEDSPMNQLTILAWLEHLGYQARAVENGRLAVEALATGEYAAVLMDCQMPAMDGYEATATIRARENGGPRLPIIAMTASVQAADRERCLAAGMDDYLAKPVDPNALAQALRRWIGSASEAAASSEAPPDAADLPLEPALDPERLDGLASIRTADGETLVDRMIGFFVASAPEHVQAIRAAAASGDLAGLSRLAHRLTGESATVGAVLVGRLAREIEQRTDAGTAPDEIVYDRLDRAVAEAIAALREYQATTVLSSVA